MNRLFVPVVLGISALVSVAIGFRALLAPSELAGSLGLAVIGADGLNEIRAQYGGFFLGTAVTCVLALLKTIPRPSALLLLMVVFGGILAGRIISLAFDGGIGVYSSTILTLYAVDLIGFGAAAFGLKSEYRQNPAKG